MYNLYFYNKYYERYINFLKYSKNKYNFLQITNLKKIFICFNIKELTEINHSSILSCIFFFKYYFGVIPFFNNYKYLFKLNVHYFDFSIEYNFIKFFMYYTLFYFINDIYYMINKTNLNLIKFNNYWEYTITDMNFFVEKKNSLGFFNLKYNLILQLHLCNINFNPNILNIYKIKNE
jgi:hypothetical protein